MSTNSAKCSEFVQKYAKKPAIEIAYFVFLPFLKANLASLICESS